MAWISHQPKNPHDPVIMPAGWTMLAYWGGLWYLLDVFRQVEREDGGNLDWFVPMLATLGVIVILRLHRFWQKRHLARLLREQPVPVIIDQPAIGFVTTTRRAAAPRRFYVPAGTTLAFTALVYFVYNHLRPVQCSPNESLYVAVGAMLLFYFLVARPNQRPDE